MAAEERSYTTPTTQPAGAQTVQSAASGERSRIGPASNSQIYWPDPYKVLTQGYSAQHRAWDIEAPMGTSVFAPVSGTVIRTTPMDPYGWGNAIEIQTPQGFQIYFAHLSKFLVAPGQQVQAGQEIALSGNTYTPPGHSTGPHLHFEVRNKAGVPIDPATFFQDASLTLPEEPGGQSIAMSKISQSMQASSSAPENASSLANPSTSSPSAPSLSSPAQPSQPAISQSEKITAPSSAGSTPSTSAPAASKTAASSSTTSGDTVFAQFDLVDSPMIGKISLKITPRTICIVLGLIIVSFGMLLTGLEPIMKNGKMQFGWIKDAAKQAPKALESAAKTGAI